MKKIKNFLFYLILVLISCDGAVEIKIMTLEENSFSGLFETDTLTNGTPVPYVDILINLAGSDKEYNGIEYQLQTDSLGMIWDHLPVPPLKKEDVYEGFITWSKEGYKQDTIFFNHSSISKRIAVINMERSN